MNWYVVDEICIVEFKGFGYRYFVVDKIEGLFNFFNVNNYEGVWLDSKVYDLGCRGKKFKVFLLGMFNI